MDGASVNGGNAATPRDDSNLEGVDCGSRGGGDGSGGGAATATMMMMAEMQDSASNKVQPASAENADAQEVNGDLKGATRKSSDMQSPRRKLKKYKPNSAGEGDSAEALGIRDRKRKFSDAFDDASSEDSGEFNGFDSQGLDLQPGSHVLSKLIGSTRYSALV